jgi:hypothetical protein
VYNLYVTVTCSPKYAFLLSTVALINKFFAISSFEIVPSSFFCVFGFDVPLTTVILRGLVRYVFPSNSTEALPIENLPMFFDCSM